VRKALRITRTVVLAVAVVYVALCAVVYAMMRQPPPVLARFMDKVPAVGWMTLPMETLWTWASRGDLGPGAEAPDFELPTVDGASRVRLSALRGKPVVLVFGSYTCPPFRKKMPDINGLYEKYRERAAFYFVYIEEAHSTDGWPSKTNAREGVLYARAQKIEDRVQAGETCWTKLKIPFPMLVDDLDDHVGRRYQAWPIRVYIVDKDGKIAFKTLPGPFGFEADLVRPAFDKHLGAPAST